MDRKTFLNAILENPHDETARLDYAAWLEERGDPRGEFIRLQCELAHLDPADPLMPAMQKRADALLQANRRKWEGPLADLADFSWFAGGFIWCIGIKASRFVRHADAIFCLAPVISVFLKRANRYLRTLVAMPELANLTALYLDGNRLDDVDAIMLAECCHLRNLITLNLNGGRVSDAGVATLASSPNLPGLRNLFLGANQISPYGAWTLGNSVTLTNVRNLVLSSNQLGDEGARALAATSGLVRLRELDLIGNQITCEGACALAKSQLVARLARLDLRHNHIRNRGALGLTELIGKRLELRLEKNPLGQQGKAMLKEHFGAMVHL